MAPPRSLLEVAKNKAILQVTCRRCRHRTVLYTVHLIARFGSEVDIYSLAPKLRCSACGGLGIADIYEITR